MKRLPLPAIALALTTAAAPLWGNPLPETPANMSPLETALTGVDFVPGRSQLDQLSAGDVRTLVGLANSQDEDADAGIRLRAYRSLRLFSGDPVALTGLRDAVQNYHTARAGIELLYLMAALDSLGALGDELDVPAIAPLLDATESRDLRAAAARALGAVEVPAACAPLQARLAVEPDAMVRVAINRALIHLGAARCQVP